MTDDELMTIGCFSRMSGLSVHTLRHYDDVGLLTPAEVDPANGYRHYRRDQLRQVRVILALRWIDLPVEEIRARDALAAGATEMVAPHDSQGMPRNSAVKDASSNWIWLYQG